MVLKTVPEGFLLPRHTSSYVFIVELGQEEDIYFTIEFQLENHTMRIVDLNYNCIIIF